ncbi:hypothetical protein [Nonomuraea sp. C10]|uniref:hypothetical protein n=1 Tax=Nonomuraea sp. C10 TaxID=2600577 RepID=UPI0011CDAA4E|nr:hypothetical protein [Nonomuraea sp. C10]TXK34274.1 hypothetical protein FR742_33380 [Nonomuraea sp. C10]
MRAFAELMREYLDMMGTSLRAASRMCYLDQGTISRMLSGARVPHWRTVEQFLSVAAQQQGRELTREEQMQARELLRSALRVRNATKWEIERLERELEEAREEQRYSAAREKLVTRELEARNKQIGQLEEQIREIQVQNRMLEGSDRAKAQRAIEHNKADYNQILKEHDELKQQRSELIVELSKARAAKEATELRCSQLIQELEEAKAKLVAAESFNDYSQEEGGTQEEGKNGAPPMFNTGQPLTVREKKAIERALDRKTLQVNTAFVYLLSFAMSAYLGWVFSSVAHSSMLSGATLWGVLVPVLLTLAATRVRRPQGSWSKHLIVAAAIVAICFFLGNRLWP